MFCSNCGKEIDDKAVVCIHCGCAVGNQEKHIVVQLPKQQKSYVAALLLCFFLGTLGAHHFYTGRPVQGLIMLVITFTGIGLIITIPWAIIEFFIILCGGFGTADGGKLV